MLTPLARVMPTPDKPHDPHKAHRRPYLLTAGLIGIYRTYQFALGLYFSVLWPPLLPEDLRLLGIGAESLNVDRPKLVPWLHAVLVVLGGEMAAVGALAVAFALRPTPDIDGGRQLVLLGVACAFSVGTMSTANFALGSDFRWLLAIPAGALMAGLALATLSRVRAGTTAFVSAKSTEGDRLE